ncbi:hypothetical protein [Streptomyces thermospinosisporus]|uniref:hypothetical protein n=1 Tax=Streptomyces thermospinosisporus TaxID=161482 RepID=UPI003CD06D1E
MLLRVRIQKNASGRPGPNVVTGQYRASWDVKVTVAGGQVSAMVFTNAPQSRRLEYGFVGVDRLGRQYRQPPYPHIEPAFSGRPNPASWRPCGAERCHDEPSSTATDPGAHRRAHYRDRAALRAHRPATRDGRWARGVPVPDPRQPARRVLRPVVRQLARGRDVDVPGDQRRRTGGPGSVAR